MNARISLISDVTGKGASATARSSFAFDLRPTSRKSKKVVDDERASGGELGGVLVATSFTTRWTTSESFGDHFNESSIRYDDSFCFDSKEKQTLLRFSESP